MNLALLAVTALPFVVTPGASFSITLSAATTGDRWASVKVWAGTSLGVVTIAAVAGLSGLAQLASESDAVRTIFGVVGGVVLLALGVKSIAKTIRPSERGQPAGQPNPKVILWAFLTLIVNVKALSLYTLVVPGLRSASLHGARLFFAFASVHVVMLLAWLLLVAGAVRLIPTLQASRRARDVLGLLAAGTLVILGVRSCITAMA